MGRMTKTKRPMTVSLSHAGTTIKLMLSDGTELTHHVSFGD